MLVLLVQMFLLIIRLSDEHKTQHRVKSQTLNRPIHWWIITCNIIVVIYLQFKGDRKHISIGTKKQLVHMYTIESDDIAKGCVFTVIFRS